MNIDVLMAVNADGHVINRNIFALPDKVYNCDGLERVLGHRLVMIPKSILPMMYDGIPPVQLGVFTTRVLVSASERAAARLTVGFKHKSEEVELGDITIIGTPYITETLEGMGVDYNLAIISPINAPIPEELYDGFARDGSFGDESYTVHYFKPSISETTDLKISNIIDGIERGDDLTDEEQQIVDRFAGNFSAAYDLEIAADDKFNRVDSYDDGNDEGIVDDEIGSEIGRIWKSLDMTASQIKFCLNENKELATAFNKFCDEYKKAKDAETYATPVYKDMIPVRVTSLEGSYNGIVNQFAALKMETDEQIEKLETKVKRLYAAIIAVLLISVVVGLIN